MEYSHPHVLDADTIFFIGSNTDSAATERPTLHGDLGFRAFMHPGMQEPQVGNNLH
ncbi:hypothetical protein ACUNV4_08355 [Granulosicoccus sp. 3-233]